jgi:uncharacterized RDD family membrane protein YckC
MSGAAQQEETLEEVAYVATESAAALRQVVSERLEAHRRKRAQAGATKTVAETVSTATRSRPGASRVREAVAARYQNSVSYREFLAQEAERALQQAQAEADIAAHKAQAMAEAQMQLLEELRQWDEPQPGPREIALAEHKAEMRDHPAHAVADVAVAPMELMEQQPLAMSSAADVTAGLTVRLYEDLSAVRPPIESARRVVEPVEADEHEATALDEEIAFRRAPEFEQHIRESIAISGNLIEFPRQLVAARKARPRLAEGPLREESAPEPQLRIFEVEPEQISAAPAELAGAPEWQSILLEAAPAAERVSAVEAQFHYNVQPLTASFELRLMAAAVDACCVGAALVGFAAVVGELSGKNLLALPLPLLGATAAIVAGVLFVLYQMLFFTLGEATPGMRYARIGLCTFADENPTRSAMRRRVLATLLAACPLGLGLAWAWLDDDGLGWHDRISRMYQRAY